MKSEQVLASHLPLNHQIKVRRKRGREGGREGGREEGREGGKEEGRVGDNQQYMVRGGLG